MKLILNRIVFLGIATLFLGFNVFAQSSAGSKQSRADFFGAVDHHEYVNRYFGFRVKIPIDFTIMDSAEATLVSNAGADALKNEGNKAPKQIDRALSKQATLLAVTMKPMGLFPNAAFEIVVSKQPAGVTANMALLASVKLLTSSSKFKLTRTFPNARFGGQKFAGALIDGEMASVALSQEMYIIMRRGYAIVIACTYSTDEGREEMMTMMNALTFTK